MKITKQQLKQIIKEELSAAQKKDAKELLAQGLISQAQYEERLNPQKKEKDDMHTSPTRMSPSGDSASTSNQQALGAAATAMTANQPTEKAQLLVVAKQLEIVLAKIIEIL